MTGADQQSFEAAAKVRARRMLTWLIVFAIVMFFAGLTSAYLVVNGGSEYWVRFRIPEPFYWSTGAILLSSAFAHLALVIAKRGGTRAAVAGMLVITLVLGGAFATFQFQGWGKLVSVGQYLSGSKLLQPTGTYGEDYVVTRNGALLDRVDGSYYEASDTAHERPLNADMADRTNQASQFFYVLTFAHLAHIFFGLASLLVMVAMAARGRYTTTSHTGLWAGVVFWHFLGGLWVYLLLFLSYVH